MKMKDSKAVSINLQTILIASVVIIIGIIFTVSNNSPKDNKGPKQAAVSASGNIQEKSIDNSFVGDKGKTLQINSDKVYIPESEVSDGNLHIYNIYSENEAKNIYFFIVKASDGTYRAAANACEVCYGAKKGFSQVGDKIRCDNCRTVYSKDQIALQRGGCNPRPIDKNVKVVEGNLEINLSDIENSADLF